MVCFGFEPGAAEWKVQMNPLSYGGNPPPITANLIHSYNIVTYSILKMLPATLLCFVYIKVCSKIFRVPMAGFYLHCLVHSKQRISVLIAKKFIHFLYFIWCKHQFPWFTLLYNYLDHQHYDNYLLILLVVFEEPKKFIEHNFSISYWHGLDVISCKKILEYVV